MATQRNAAAERPRKLSPSEQDRPEVKVEEGVQPLKAVHHIVFGAAQNAVPQSIFTPVSEAERNELLANGAAVELDDIEASAIAPISTAAETPPSDPDVIA